jgi:Arabinose efflux permease
MNKNRKDKLWTKDFSLIWQGQLVSTMGDASYSIALGFWILQATGSTALMGTLMAVSALPGILISPFAGVWIERVNRKRLLIVMDFLRGISMLIIAYAAFTNRLAVWMMFAAGILLSACGAVFRPGINSSIPEMVPIFRLTNANSILSIASTGSNMFGNIAGGFLYQLLGAPLLFLFNGLSYFFSGSSLTFVKIPKSKTKTQLKFFRDMLDGFCYVWKQKGLRYILMITAILNFFFFTAIVLFLPLFQQTAYLGAGRYGISMACFMGGAMAGFLFTSVIKIPWQKRLSLFILSVIISNISLIIALNQHIFGIMLLFILLGGFFNSIINVILPSAIQVSASSEMRGKVMAFTSMTTQCLTPLAMFFGGFLSLYLPIKSIITMSFVTMIFIIIPFAFVKPFAEFLNYNDEIQQQKLHPTS